MAENPKLLDFNIERITDGHIITVPMASRTSPGGDFSYVTELEIIVKGIEPIVKILATEEGETEGPSMRFLGSIATQELLEEKPEQVVTGHIIGTYRLVVENRDEPKGRTTLSGTVGNEAEPRITRRSRRRPDPEDY